MKIESIFLREFTRNLIINSMTPEARKLFFEKASNPIALQSSEKKENFPIEVSPKIETSIVPQFQVTHESLNLEVSKNPMDKISSFLKDPSVTSIECSGPNKFISVKRGSRAMITKTTLTNEDISYIIDYFSAETSIPRVGGTFKAILNNLILTAIESPVGNRFIISKITSQPSQFM